MFIGRKLLIATKHKKEKVIGPILEKELGVECFVDNSFDTDALGTFTGEIERAADSLTTARQKCLLAMAHANCDLAIASEGSFGPHPTIFFVAADEEFLLFIDKKNDLEIIVREISTATNFRGAAIKSEQELKDFADAAKFPSHGLILRKNKADFAAIKKGITDWETLLKSYRQIVENNGFAYVETDMRAMYNPSRLKVIEDATTKLAEKINTHCPQCDTPGFGKTDAKFGLPCALCSSPTRSILSFIYACHKCSFTQEEKYPLGKMEEDPMYCDVCNP